jgi:hypothetical protein
LNKYVVLKSIKYKEWVKDIVSDKNKSEILVLVVVGILLLFHGIKNYWDKWDINRNRVSAIGIVIDVENDSSGESSISTIEFVAEDGKVYSFQSGTEYTVGEKLPILYKRGNPSKVYIQDFYGTWFWASFKIISGIVSLLTARGRIKGKMH